MQNDEIEDALLMARKYVTGGSRYRRHNEDDLLDRIERALILRSEESRQRRQRENPNG